MKKLLITTAFVALGFASSAMASEAIYSWNLDGITYYGTLNDYNNAADFAAYNDLNLSTPSPFQAAGGSLLETLLSGADGIQNTMSNITENLSSSVDGSVNIDLSAGDLTNVDTPLATVVTGLDATIGDLKTTAIGAFGTGTVTADLTLSDVTELSQAVSGTAKALSATFDPARPESQIYNMTSNLAEVNGSVNLDGVGMALNDLASASTTAIGAFGTGTISNTVVNNATALNLRMVGTN